MIKDIELKVIIDIVANNLRDDFLKVVKQYKHGQFNRDIDERYAEGMWDLTASLVDDLQNENQYELVYNTLWEIAEKIADDEIWDDYFNGI
jgi:hypothetical protein